MYILCIVFQTEHKILETRSASPSSGENVELASWFDFITLYAISFTILLLGICWKMYNFYCKFFYYLLLTKPDPICLCMKAVQG